MDNYKKKVTSNLLWRFAERCGSQGMYLIVSIILTLPPPLLPMWLRKWDCPATL